MQIKLAVAKRKYLTFQLTQKQLKLAPITLLHWASFITIIVGVLLYIRGSIIEDYSQANMLHLICTITLILFILQLIKLFWGGSKYFPESVFDLASLILAIGLITTLLTKQLFDLDIVNGMLPREQDWYFTIFGILILCMFSYFVDISVRYGLDIKKTLVIFPVITEIILLIQLLIGATISIGFFQILLPMIAFEVALYYLIKQKYLSLGMLINLLLIGGYVLFTVNVSIQFLFLISVIFLVLLLVMTKTYSLHIPRRSLKKYLKTLPDKINRKSIQRAVKSFKIKDLKIEKSSYLKSILSILAIWLIVILIYSIFANTDLYVIKDNFRDNLEIIKSTDNFQNAVIGGNFEYYNETTFSNIYSSYGLLGMVLFIGFVTYSIYIAYLNTKGLAQIRKIKFRALVNTISLLVNIYFLVSVIFSSCSSYLFILFFINTAAIGSEYMYQKKKELQDNMMNLNNLKNQRLRLLVLISQVSMTFFVVVVGTYMLLELEEVLSNI